MSNWVQYELMDKDKTFFFFFFSFKSEFLISQIDKTNHEGSNSLDKYHFVLINTLLYVIRQLEICCVHSRFSHMPKRKRNTAVQNIKIPSQELWQIPQRARGKEIAPRTIKKQQKRFAANLWLSPPPFPSLTSFCSHSMSFPTIKTHTHPGKMSK